MKERLITLPQRIPDNDKNNYCTKATTTQFFCTVTGNKASEDIIHTIRF
jgi:hypothetical protein